MSQDHELRLKINAAAARSGAKQFTTALADIRKAVTDLDRAADSSFKKMSKGAKVNIDSSTAKASAVNLKNAAKGVSQFDQAAKRLALSSAAALRTSNSQFDRLYEKAERLGDTQGIRTLTTALGQLETRLARASSPLDVRAARSQFSDVASDIMRTNRQLEIQERKANIAAASMSKLATTQQATTSMFRAGNGALRQTSFQLSQIAQQGAVTGDYLRAAAIQIPDLLLPFGTVAILAGAALGALAPLAIDLLGGADAAKVFDERLKSLQETQSGLTAVSDILTMTTQELADKYGNAAIRVREFAVLQAGLRISDLSRQMAEQSTVLQDVSSKYVSTTNSGRTYRNTLARIASDFGITGQAARQFETSLQAASNASTFDQQVSAIRDIQRQLKAAGVSASDLPPEFAAALDQAINLSNETDAARKTADDLATSVSTIGPNITPAVNEAAKLKAELAAALALQNRLNQQEYLADGYSGRGQDPRRFEDGPQYTGDLDYTSPAEIIAEAQRKAARSAKRSGGGRSKKLSDETRAIQQSVSAIQSRHRSLQAESRALQLVAEGQFKTTEAARLFAEAEIAGAKNVDAKTLAMLAQVDAATALKQAQESNPLANITADLKTSTKDAISSALQGEFNFESFTQGIRSSLANALSTQITDNLFPSLSKNAQGAKNAAMMQAALTSGGTTAAAQIRAAMLGSAAPVAGAIGAAGQTHAATVGATIQATGQQHAAAVGAATSSSTGGGGFFGMIGGLFGIPVGREGFTTSGVSPTATAMASPAAFRHAPSYSAGTENTSGIPAILHPNEAVIPLTKGRKVGVDLGSAAGGDTYIRSVGDISVDVTVEGSGDDQSNQEQAALIGETVAVMIDSKINERMAEQMQYGGMLRPRGR